MFWYGATASGVGSHTRVVPLGCCTWTWVTISNVRPSVQVSTLFRSGQVSAQVDAELEVQMLETETGASIWSRSATTTRTLGQVSVFGGKDFAFNAAEPEAAYGELIDALVSQVARDLQGSWQTQ